MGFAGAYTAQAADPSAIFHNAAGIAFLKGRQLYLGGTLIAPKFDFTGDDPFPGAGVQETSAIGLILPPAAYYTQRFSETVVFGIGFNVPFGLRTEWANPDGFTGRFVSQVAELNAYSINPTIAFQLADRLAVGGGVDVRLSTVELRRRAAVINPFTQRVADAAQVRLRSDSSTAIGFNVGLLAKPSESLAIGAAYRHKVNQEYTGTASFQPLATGNAQLDALLATRLPTGNVPLTTAIEFPAIASLGVSYAWGDWTVEADVNWYQWSSFDNLILRFESNPELNQVLEQHYDDVFQYRVGLERVVNDAWTVRGGYFFDTSPSPPESLSPILPDADRQGIALGATWRQGRFRVDLANWLVLFKERSTGGASRSRFDGTYKSFAETFGVSIGYSF
jgi:long-chain fatty acid transport protein